MLIYGVILLVENLHMLIYPFVSLFEVFLIGSYCTYRRTQLVLAIYTSLLDRSKQEFALFFRQSAFKDGIFCSSVLLPFEALH